MITKELQNMKPLKGDEKLERDSEYMGADDIDQNTEPVLTIRNLYRGKVTLSRGKEVKNVLTFVEDKVQGINEVRPLIVNSTNRQTLKKLYGQVTANALEGKQIQLYIEHGVRNPSNGELTDGIRIRDKKPTAGGVKPKAAVKCAECGKEIVGSGSFTAEQIATGSRQKYGKALCMVCAQKKKAEMEASAKKAAEDAEALKAEEAQTHEASEQDDLAAKLAAAAEE